MAISIPMEYDYERGEFVRKLKTVKVWHIASTPSTSVAAGAVLASTTVPSSREVYITGYVFSTTSAGNGVYVTIGTSTVLPTIMDANKPVKQTASRQAPIAKADAGSTVSIVAVNAGTYSVALWGVEEPIPSYIETA